MKAMILAAGLGTRLKPLTQNTPKALVQINNKTLLELVVERLKSQGVNEIIINVFHFADQIIHYLKDKNNFGIHIEISKESELLDTGGGLKRASWIFDDGKPFVLYNVDVISNIDLNEMLEYHKANQAQTTIAVRSRKTSRYFLFDSNHRLSGWQNTKTNEKKIVLNTEGDLNPRSFMGIHIISPEIFKNFPAKDKFSIVDFYLQIAQSEKIVGFPADKYRWVDCGKPENLKAVQKEIANFKSSN